MGWFTGKQADFQKKITDWQAKQKAVNANPKKKTDDDEDPFLGADIFTLEDVSDIGNGEPLFQKFDDQDWALMKLRWELHLLPTAFKKDVDGPDRQAIPQEHVGFYYQKYFKKNLNLKCFNVDSLDGLVEYCTDSVKFEDEMLSSSLAEDTGPEMIVKMTEEKRRERQRRIDAGDETARLKFTPGKTDEQ